MPDPTPPQVNDPGLIVTGAQIQDYAFTVDKLIRDINARVYESESAPKPVLIPMEVWKKWVLFRIDWEKRLVGYKTPGWMTSGSDYDAIRKTHLEALGWKEKFTAYGVDFAGMQAPAPGSYSIEPGKVLGDVASAVTVPLMVGAVALAILLAAKK